MRAVTVLPLPSAWLETLDFQSSEHSSSAFGFVQLVLERTRFFRMCRALVVLAPYAGAHPGNQGLFFSVLCRLIITFQNYFRMYKKLAGMTGTATTSAEEFSRVYGIEVVPVPTNKAMAREDMADKVYQSQEAKFNAIIEEIKEHQKKGQPVLVGTGSIQRNEYLSKLLGVQGVAHELLMRLAICSFFLTDVSTSRAHD